MSLESEKKSPHELKQQARQQLQLAGRVEPCVAVTEANWKSLLAAQQTQTDMLEELLQAMIPIATKDELVDYLNQQLGVLQQESVRTRHELEQYLEGIRKELAAHSKMLTEAKEHFQAQVGKTSETFSSALSEEQSQMRRYEKRLFRAALIPLLLLWLSEWTPRIWQWISQMF